MPSLSSSRISPCLISPDLKSRTLLSAHSLNSGVFNNAHRAISSDSFSGNVAAGAELDGRSLDTDLDRVQPDFYGLISAFDNRPCFLDEFIKLFSRPFFNRFLLNKLIKDI